MEKRKPRLRGGEIALRRSLRQCSQRPMRETVENKDIDGGFSI